MTTQQQLKPCPFCGGEARFNDHEAGKDGMPRFASAVFCTQCGISTGYMNSADEIAKFWNLRSSPTHAELVALLKAINKHVFMDDFGDYYLNPDQVWTEFAKLGVEL